MCMLAVYISVQLNVFLKCIYTQVRAIQKALHAPPSAIDIAPPSPAIALLIAIDLCCLFLKSLQRKPRSTKSWHVASFRPHNDLEIRPRYGVVAVDSLLVLCGVPPCKHNTVISLFFVDGHLGCLPLWSNYEQSYLEHSSPVPVFGDHVCAILQVHPTQGADLQGQGVSVCLVS